MCDVDCFIRPLYTVYIYLFQSNRLTDGDCLLLQKQQHAVAHLFVRYCCAIRFPPRHTQGAKQCNDNWVSRRTTPGCRRRMSAKYRFMRVRSIFSVWVSRALLYSNLNICSIAGLRQSYSIGTHPKSPIPCTPRWTRGRRSTRVMLWLRKKSVSSAKCSNVVSIRPLHGIYYCTEQHSLVVYKTTTRGRISTVLYYCIGLPALHM